MFDIALNARTADGRDLNAVMLRHAPEDGEKLARIAENMERDGWIGRPVILADGGDCTIALTGCHRLAAAIGRDGIEAVWLPDDLTSDDWAEIDAARDDDDLLAAFEMIAESRDDMDDVVAAMRAEIEAN